MNPGDLLGAWRMVSCTRYIDGRALMGDAFINNRGNFVDGGHLNVPGATEFSRALADALRPSSVPP